MGTLPGRLGELRARDVMTNSLITVRDDDSLVEAVDKLRSSHITGAPVVDAKGTLVGILSLSDLVAAAGSTEARPAGRLLAHGEDSTAWDLYDRSPRGDDPEGQTVADRMSPSVTSVTRDASLVEVARSMCDGHWHRVPVVDNRGALKGIISTMDVLAALVNAADEAR